MSSLTDIFTSWWKRCSNSYYHYCPARLGMSLILCWEKHVRDECYRVLTILIVVTIAGTEDSRWGKGERAATENGAQSLFTGFHNIFTPGGFSQYIYPWRIRHGHHKQNPCLKGVSQVQPQWCQRVQNVPFLIIINRWRISWWIRPSQARVASGSCSMASEFTRSSPSHPFVCDCQHHYLIMLCPMISAYISELM